MTNKLSIITPSFNAEKTIEKTLLSVIAQRHSCHLGEQLEYIVVDGGSTDGTLEILKRYETQIDRIISEPDRGAYDAMNKGIQQATGDIVGIINADDWYNDRIFDLVVQAFQSDPHLAVLYSPIDNYYEGEYVATFRPGNLDKLPIRFTLNHPSCFIKKTAYDQVGLYNLQYKIAADYDLLLRLFLAGHRFTSLDRSLASYSLNGMSSSTRMIDRIKLIQECWRVGERHSDSFSADLQAERKKAYAIWVVNECFALPARRLLKPPAARKLKALLSQIAGRSLVSDAYGKW